MVKASGPMFENTKIDAGWNVLIKYIGGSEFYFTAYLKCRMLADQKFL